MEKEVTIDGVKLIGWAAILVERLENLKRELKLLDKRVIYFEQIMAEIRGKLSKAGIEIKDNTRV